ncbi:hypothetical protein [Pedobacter insulae]|uniref:Uncharacterized protein n=1 Tax=Pedobacter insulae TaxID=414048 RepID=A0A1I2T7M8_9SPHI|nr:hypothetical protein [Pedobacter insulae]SFG58586.1 hypothetical protein SAMN04489864_101154 [Pedobacter insulae]
MEKQYDLSGCVVSVLYSPKLVQIIGSTQLLTFLNHNLSLNTLQLAKLIKADYQRLFGKRLKITNASLMVEIWGHLYASHFANVIKELIKLKVIGDLTALINKRSDTIDCGEADIDTNRGIWDTLSKFNHIIIKCLPKPSNIET